MHKNHLFFCFSAKFSAALKFFPLLRNPLIITATTAVLITIVHFINRKNSRKIKFCLIPPASPTPSSSLLEGNKLHKFKFIQSQRKIEKSLTNLFIFRRKASISFLCCAAWWCCLLLIEANCFWHTEQKIHSREEAMDREREWRTTSVIWISKQFESLLVHEKIKFQSNSSLSLLPHRCCALSLNFQ